MTVRPTNPNEPLPELVRACSRLIIDEAQALRAALSDFSDTPAPGSPHESDRQAWSHDTGSATERRELLHVTQHQARLICINAYDHLLTLGRALGSDGAMSLYAHASLSRVVCEAAVRFAWILDSSISSEERIMRGAVALLVSAEERLRGALRVPTGHLDPHHMRLITDNSTAERDNVQTLIDKAGLIVVRSRDNKRIARLELASPKASVPVRLDVTELMSELLPDSPAWYNLSSGVTHSYYWALRGAVASSPGESLVLAPDLLEIAAAAQTAISASALVIARCAAYYGRDPQLYVRQSGDRRKTLDPYMRQVAASRGAKTGRSHGGAAGKRGASNP
ncbi:hypothetical protein [Actinomadura sp. DC4]|uniref:hypothetical protein n=1 Tax=Actinomadura sp. DC4 TaxID=3055069 RepID=UPI0025B22D32|nr:hypothetical protein [Actinomadura sp. DC4]MDN3353183.1 hypothetical protein [Actinomadura sp. DC4]